METRSKYASTVQVLWPVTLFVLLIAVGLLTGSTAANAVCSITYTFSNGTTADATQVNTNFSDVAACAGASSFWTVSGSSLVPTSTSYNVGIGTTSPSAKLYVDGNIYATGSIACGGTCGSGGGGSSDWSRIGYSLTPLLTSYNVGIGIDSAVYKLDVTPGSTEVAAHFSPSNGADSGFYITPHAPNDVVIGSGANYGSGVFTAKATSAEILNLYAGGYYLYGDTGLTVGATYTPTLRMIVASNGYVGIGTASPSYLLHVNGTAYATGAAGALSDVRHKSAISSLGDGVLSKVMQLRPVSFEWKNPRDEGMKGRQTGFVAQEVERLFPSTILTQGDSEKTKGLKYNELIAILTKALQEQQREIQTLKQTVRQQSAGLVQLRTEMATRHANYSTPGKTAQLLGGER